MRSSYDNLKAIQDFMRVNNACNKRGIFAEARVERKGVGCIFDGDVDCLVTDGIPFGNNAFEIVWEGLNDTAMRSLKMRGIYYIQQHMFEFDGKDLLIHDFENDITVFVKRKE